MTMTIAATTLAMRTLLELLFEELPDGAFEAVGRLDLVELLSEVVDATRLRQARLLLEGPPTVIRDVVRALGVPAPKRRMTCLVRPNARR